RLVTLNDSAFMGIASIIILLGLFLRPAVAFWVCLGVPIAFMGAFALMPYFGATINLLTLYGFILVLGILVDDAIVTGERIHAYQQQGGSALDCAIKGTQEVATPVIFGVLTTAIAFVPLLLVEGRRGQMFAQIPMVVIPCLLFSLVESKLILPAHLSHLSTGKPPREKLGLFSRIQRWFADGLEWCIERIYRPVLDTASAHRYTTLCIFTGMALVICSYSFSGRLLMVFFPPIDSEYATARLVMPQGTAHEITEEKLQKMIDEAYALKANYTGEYVDPESGETKERSVIGDIITTIGGQNIAGVRGPASSGVANLGEVQMQLMAPEDRIYFNNKSLHHLKTRALVKEWRGNIGMIQGAREITTKAVIGRSRDPIAIKLAMPALDTSAKTTTALSEVSSQIKAELEQYEGLFDIHDTFERIKEEVRPRLKSDAMQRGITRAMIGRQVQGGFFGHEAQRIQRGQNEVRVMVRYPIEERESMASLENMRIRLPEGGTTPLTAIADLEMTDSYPSIRRSDLARTLYVLADADKDNPALDLKKVREDLEPKVAELAAQHPGMTYRFDGEGRERKESMAALEIGSIIVLLGIFAMLAIPFKSYTQPLIVMAIIPFSIMGALLGHMIMDIPFSIMSAFGLLAMAGVVVNDSLVMVHYINLKRDEGMPLTQAVSRAGGARFRPILLTSLTTFGGILPTMFEKSTQAQFVVPMGISLAWGVLFATFITLILVPICYLILEDIKSGLSRYWNWQTGRKPQPVAA
ncbi:MAG: efflux RND transporter permease subunit, partial [Verrucomicrobiota bacterium]|nr:efflux RND transporter permease subunit [Verrucomicrobiota bacterium]